VYMGEVQGPSSNSILGGQEWLQDPPGRQPAAKGQWVAPPPQPPQDRAQVQSPPAYGIDPAQARFPAPPQEGIVDRLGRGIKQLKDRVTDPIRQIKEDYEQIGALLSRPDLTSQDVREAAAHARNLSQSLSFMPLLKTLAEDLDILARHVATAEDRLAASDLPGLECAVQGIKQHLQLMEQHLPMIDEKIQRAIRGVEEKQQVLAAGRDVLWRFDQTADGDILTFLEQSNDQQRLVLLGLSNEAQFTRLFDNASYSIVFEVYGGDDLASSIVEKAGAQLGRLQPFKLGVMAGHLCHGHTSERDERALIGIAKTLEKHELASFLRGLEQTEVPFTQFLEELVEYGDEQQETLEALAQLYRATAEDRARRVDLQLIIDQLPEASRDWLYRYLGPAR
ncbi:MAG TPA: hypothetical protein VJ417_06830, partial [Candidatus Glassbacteria bacterium]|nr:hypothetical protein [Candidatus Glassbacteria bacterium]